MSIQWAAKLPPLDRCLASYAIHTGRFLRAVRARQFVPEWDYSLSQMSRAVEAVLRRDRAIVIAALAIITALAWADIIWLADDMAMGGMDMTGFRMIPAGQGLMMPANAPWQPIEFAYVFAMWAAMMIGMMTPSAAPMILIYARVGRQASTSGHPFAASGWFVSGYLVAWLGFSLAATSGQWVLERAALLTPMMESVSAVLAGIVLIAAGIYQWTPVKEACLSYCQAPLTFIMRHGGFRPDPAGALTLGVRHGLYCIGCCWAFMLLLFVGGIMNLLWIAALAGLVLLEKVLPFGKFVSRTAGCVFIASGVWLLFQI
jgi:predicted metal-binding membrane protein